MARALGVLVLSLAAAPPAIAGQSRAGFAVSVRVPARATVTAVESPGALDISARDVERGYKEVATRYRVASTGARGYLLQLAPRIGLARRVEISGLGGEIVLGDTPLEIHRPADGSVEPGCADEFALALRVVLDPAARPGRYPMPVQLAALPL
jgi:hypothetical protein